MSAGNQGTLYTFPLTSCPSSAILPTWLDTHTSSFPAHRTTLPREVSNFPHSLETRTTKHTLNSSPKAARKQTRKSSTTVVSYISFVSYNGISLRQPGVLFSNTTRVWLPQCLSPVAKQWEREGVVFPAPSTGQGFRSFFPGRCCSTDDGEEMMTLRHIASSSTVKFRVTASQKITLSSKLVTLSGSGCRHSVKYALCNEIWGKGNALCA